MSTGGSNSLSTCGCCAGRPAPVAISNRPGLAGLSYRIGTYGLFLEEMLDQISSILVSDSSGGPTRAPLTALTTRSADDPAIALCDAWAIVADVLTFYQERIANEGFLRTATERRSVLYLARAIGFELNPGVAASVYVQFTVEEVIGTPAPAVKIPGVRIQPPAGPGSAAFNTGIVDIPQGSQVQSVPAPGGLPQTFETSADFQANVAWNGLLPRLSRPQDLALCDGSLWLLGTSTGFSSGQTVELATASVYLVNPLTALDWSQPAVQAMPVTQIYLQGTKTGLQTGDRLLLVATREGATATQAFVVRSVITDSSLNQTQVQFADNPTLPGFSPATFPPPPPDSPGTLFNQANVAEYILGTSIGESDLQAFLQRNGWDAGDLATLVNAGLTAPPAPNGAYVLGAKASFFGNNAPLWSSLINPGTSSGTTSGTSSGTTSGTSPGAILRGDPYPDTWDSANNGQGPTIWNDSQSNSLTDADANLAYLERVYPQIIAGGWAILESPAVPNGAIYKITFVVERSVADYNQSTRTLGLSFGLNGSVPGTSAGPPSSGSLPPFPVRTTTAYIQSQQQVLAEMPVADPIEAGSTEVMLDSMVLGLVPGQPVALSGTRADAPGVAATEIAILQDIVHKGGFTALELQSGLQYCYARNSLSVNANVTLATHGATVQEVLGSGDGSQANQSFTLKRPPLTYVSAPTSSGNASTLQVKVNGLQWQEAPTLYGLDSSDHNYVVRLADDGTPSVTVGDPAARLRTGQQNVTATYRTGIGLVGNVSAGSLSMLQSRPPGLRGVTNPLAASGGADPQALNDARASAPLAVLTLDRIVSLDDYQSFTQAFAGIGKAQAVELWSGAKRLVHITVADAAGNTVGPVTPLYQALVQGITLAHDAMQDFLVAGYQLVPFNVTASILVDTPTYQFAAVESQVASAIAAAFSFANRAFGQSVTAAEIITLIQSITGVVATNLTQLYLTGDPTGPAQTEPPPFLIAQIARWQAGTILPAQLLLVNPLGVALSELTS